MSNACTGTYKALSRRDIKALERQTGLSVPPDMTEYSLKQNGGLPERPCWHYQDWDLFCLSRLIPIRPADAVEADFPNRCAIQDVMADIQPGVHLPAGFLPFGEDWGSNYFCWDTAGSGVYFVPMDLGDEFDIRKKRLTDTFASFIDGLQEEAGS